MFANPDALRIHFLSAVPGRVSRAVGPLVELRADRAYLIRGGADEDEVFKDILLARLEGVGTEVQDVFVDVEDPAQVAHEVGLVVGESPDDHYRFNLSACRREVALGGFLASMFWPIRPYLAQVHEDRVDHELDEPAYSHTTDVTSFSPEEIRGEVLACLNMLVRAGGRTRQRTLVRQLHDAGFIYPKQDPGDELTAQAKQAQFQTIARAMGRRNLAVKHGHGRGCEWEITDEGRMTRKVLAGDAE